jgi:hypothetical protein
VWLVDSDLGGGGGGGFFFGHVVLAGGLFCTANGVKAASCLAGVPMLPAGVVCTSAVAPLRIERGEYK